ncbi:MAG: penicillin acylase family protein [Acidobacteriota bacterium]
MLPKPLTGRTSRFLRTTTLVAAVVLVPILLVLLCGGLWFNGQLRASLPLLEGSFSSEVLDSPVTIERDALGVPRLRGENRRDLAYALGFLHGQERFFQMDLQRRQAAGELAEIFGPAVLPVDRRARIHRFRDRATQVLGQSPPRIRRLLEAYAQGVNAGLGQLGSSPPEYHLLRQGPRPWQAEDSVLTLYAMFDLLQRFGIDVEDGLGLMHQRLPPALFDFLASQGSAWDAPLVGEAFTVPEIPTAEALLPGAPPALPEPELPEDEVKAARFTPENRADYGLAVAGSNAWVMTGERSEHGVALLANDMHLPLAMPNIWYRARLEWPGHEVTGGTLPGAPLVVIGSNGKVAWGFTNSRADTSDVVLLDLDPDDPGAYLTPQGSRRFDRATEVIASQGGREERLEVLSTVWGPVIDDGPDGRRRALRWIAHDVEAVGFGLIGMESAATVEEAIAVATESGLPAQNILLAGADGTIGWTIAGRLPQRVGHDGQVPVSWSDGTARWDGLVPPEETPRIVNPPGGQLWSANNRMVDGPDLRLIGNGGYVTGARAGIIRDRLTALDRADEQDLLAVQLDTDARFLTRWRDLLLAELDASALEGNPRRQEFRALIEPWEGRAEVGSTSYRLVRGARQFLVTDLLQHLTAPASEDDPTWAYLNALPRVEGPIWRLVTERPDHLLNPEYATWREQILATVDQLLGYYEEAGIPLDSLTWGGFNQVTLHHPLTLGVPWLGRWLNPPVEALPGDFNMPRVQQPGYGASQRMVVAPGREEEGIFHMPGGQSGHLLSPHYGDAHEAWESGEATPFLPGPSVHTLRLEPQDRSSLPVTARP